MTAGRPGIIPARHCVRRIPLATGRCADPIRSTLLRYLAHQPIGEFDFLPEGCDTNALVSAMGASVVEIIEHTVDAITRCPPQAGVLAVRRTTAHLRQHHDLRPQ